jgi:TRAP-type C4-dicarboxylate transport system substrate-binding protein
MIRTRAFSSGWIRIGVLAAVVLAGAAPALAQARIKLGTLAPRNSSYHQILQAMGEQWRQAPAGGAQLTIYTDGTMGSEADMVRRMRVGQLHAAMLTVSGLAEIDPAVGALQNMPLVYRSLEEMEFVRERLRPQIEASLVAHGFVVLGWSDAGWVRFFSRHPAQRPQDFKRMKIFVTAGSNLQVQMMKEAGYQPVPLEWSDALTSLKTGMIDALPVMPYYALAGQFYTEAKHMLEVNWAPLVGAIIISKRVWDALPAATRDAMLQSAQAACQQIKERGRKESDEAVAAMRARGLQVHKLTPEAEEAWRRAAEEFYPRIRGGMVPAATFDEVLHLLTGRRTELANGAKQ